MNARISGRVVLTVRVLQSSGADSSCIDRHNKSSALLHVCPISDPLAGSAAAEGCEGLTVVLAGGNGVAMTACFGLPHGDLLSWKSRSSAGTSRLMLRMSFARRCISFRASWKG